MSLTFFPFGNALRCVGWVVLFFFYLAVGAGCAFRVVVDLCCAVDQHFLLVGLLAQ